LRIPLALPTVSFILSFFAGPIVLTVNVPLMLWNARPIGRRAWRVLRHERRLNVDFLDALAISVSMLHGAF
jgi:cation transport ATPase